MNIVLSGGLAVGMILTSLIQGYRGNLMSVLFGDILARLVLLFVIVGSISSIVGIFVSGFFNFACDPSIVLVQFVVYVAVFGWISKKVCPTLILLVLILPSPLHKAYLKLPTTRQFSSKITCTNEGTFRQR